MLKTVHRRKTKRLLINSTSFLLSLGAGKLVRTHRMHPGLLLGEQCLKSSFLVGGRGTWWRGRCASSPTCAQQGGVHQDVVSQKDALMWEFGTVPSSLKVMTWCPKGFISLCLALRLHSLILFLLICPTPPNCGAVNREASHLTSSAQANITPMCTGRGLQWSSQELPENVFHVGSPSGLTAVFWDPSLDPFSRLYSTFQLMFPLPYVHSRMAHFCALFHLN